MKGSEAQGFETYGDAMNAFDWVVTVVLETDGSFSVVHRSESP